MAHARQAAQWFTAHRAVLVAALAAAMAAMLVAAPALAWEDAIVLSPGVGVADEEPDYVLQAKVFDDEAAARALEQELLDQGLEPYIFAAAGDDGAFRYAVRLGVYETLYQAMQAVLDLSRDHGLEAEITEDGSFTPLDFADKVFFVQVVALSKDDNLGTILQEYRAKGFGAGVVQLYDRGETWFIVHVGEFGSFSEAEIAAEGFRRSEARPCYVVMMDRALFESRSLSGS